MKIIGDHFEIECNVSGLSPALKITRTKGDKIGMEFDHEETREIFMTITVIKMLVSGAIK